MNIPTETNNGVSAKQEKSEISDDVQLIKDEALIHVNHKENLESIRGGPYTQIKLKDLLRFSKPENNTTVTSNIETPSCGFTPSHTFLRTTSETCTSVTATNNATKSSETINLCASGDANDYKTESSVNSRSNNVNMDILMSSLFSFPPSSLDKDLSSGVNRSHPIIAHILTGEDKSLGREQASYSPDRSGAYILKGNRFAAECNEIMTESSDSESDGDDVDSFIDDAICKNLMTEKLEVSSEWEMGSRCMESPPIPKAKQLENSNVLKKGTCCSLLIADVQTGSDLKHIFAETLDVTSLKVVSPNEALDMCNNEAFHLIWIHILSVLNKEFISLSNSIRFSSKQNKNAIFIALTEKVNEGELRLQSFDEVCVLPISNETIKQIYQKYQCITGKETCDTDRCVVSPESVRTPESVISIDSVRTSERSQSSQSESLSGSFDLNDISLMEIKNVPESESKKTAVDKNRSRSSRIDLQSPAWCRAEHANKEKQRSKLKKIPECTEKKRRERIKDSCDQLRVLLPYVRGRKTDMASILEMTVDYLRIITAALPQDFQSQIISIMSNGSPMLEPLHETAAKKNTRKIPTQNFSAPLKQTSDEKSKDLISALNRSNSQVQEISYAEPKSKIRIMTRSLAKSLGSSPMENNHPSSGSVASQNQNISNVYCSLNKPQANILPDPNSCVRLTKRECSSALPEGSTAKRQNLKALPTMIEPKQSKTICLPSPNVTTIKDTKREINEEMVNQMPSYHTFQLQPKLPDGEPTGHHMFTSSSMSSPDLFQLQQHPRISNMAATRTVASERELTPYSGMYFDGNYYTYFPSLTEPPSGSFCIPSIPSDYVNPNAVLPMTYNPRASSFIVGDAAEPTVNSETGLRANQESELFTVTNKSAVVKTNNL